VEHWHYSKSLPVGKVVRVGAWEAGRFIGCVLFSHGANRNLLSPYGLKQTDGCELTRVALAPHKSQTSRIVTIAVKMLSQQSIRLIVSYADMEQGHYGTIYQAMGWVYVGAITQNSKAFYRGRIAHKRTFDCAGIKGYQMIETREKHKYLMPLDNDMRKQIEPLRKPYPKRVTSDTSDTPSIHEGKGGAAPTVAL